MAAQPLLPSSTFSLIIPVYFNSQSLLPLYEALQSLEAALLPLDCRLELIFVDDGSGDDSYERLMHIKEMRPATKVIRLARNFGAVNASKTGYRYVTGDAFGVIAADLQDPVDLVVQMVTAWKAGHRFVVARRTARGDPWLTRLWATVYYRILTTIVSPTYPRGGFDLMVLDKTLLPYMQRSAKNTNPNVFAHWLGHEPFVLPYVRGTRKFGRSRWTFGKKLVFFLDTLCGFSVAPIRMISITGAIVSVMSFLYATNVVIQVLRGAAVVPGYATLVVLLSFFAGLILLMLGVLGEYVWRVFDIISGRPESVVADEHL